MAIQIIPNLIKPEIIIIICYINTIFLYPIEGKSNALNCHFDIIFEFKIKYLPVLVSKYKQ